MGFSACGWLLYKGVFKETHPPLNPFVFSTVWVMESLDWWPMLPPVSCQWSVTWPGCSHALRSPNINAYQTTCTLAGLWVCTTLFLYPSSLKRLKTIGIFSCDIDIRVKAGLKKKRSRFPVKKFWMITALKTDLLFCFFLPGLAWIPDEANLAEELLFALALWFPWWNVLSILRPQEICELVVYFTVVLGRWRKVDVVYSWLQLPSLDSWSFVAAIAVHTCACSCCSALSDLWHLQFCCLSFNLKCLIITYRPVI